MAERLQPPVLRDSNINHMRPRAPGDSVTAQDVVSAAKYVKAVEVAEGLSLSYCHQCIQQLPFHVPENINSSVSQEELASVYAYQASVLDIFRTGGESHIL
jgi:hypothetical protein